jgi:hypothetical protein
MKYNPEVWGPHYWFFLHTIAYSYPLFPNTVTKRKYYDLIQNLPLFIPNTEIANNFSNMLDKYPVTPYLDNRDSFKKWMHFIHNKINVLLGKDEISFDKAEEIYEKSYLPKKLLLSEKFHLQKHHIYLIFTIISFFLIYIFYKE